MVVGSWELNPLGQPEPQMNYSWVAPFEKDFDFRVTSGFFRERGMSVSLAFSAAYLLIILVGGRLMRSGGPRLELRSLLVLWNLGLALFSMAGAYRMLPELYHVLTNFGLDYSICNPSYVDQPITSFWTAAFAWSKVWELGDTVFLVLRRRPIIFLHCYHHVTVLIYCWHACSQHTAVGRWFACVNFLIHSVMYSYYAARAAGIRRLPSAIPLLITSSQLAQMLLGFWLGWRVWSLKLAGVTCVQSWENLAMCLIMYASYAILFANFFYHAYLKPKTKSSQPRPFNANGYDNSVLKKSQ